MNAAQRDRFLANHEWSNEFFQDVMNVFDRISGGLSKELSPPTQRNLFYPKANMVPGLPPHYAQGLAFSDSGFAVQAFVVIDPDLFGSQDVFEKDISFVIVKHADPDRYHSYNEYGLRVIRDVGGVQGIEPDGTVVGFVAGQTPFYAFQIPIDYFLEGRDLEAEIHQRIVKPICELPDFRVRAQSIT